MDYVLIAHGGWHESDGQRYFYQDGVEHETIVNVPKGLTICIYNLQNTPLSVTNGLVLLNRLLRDNLGSVPPGEHCVDGMSVYYKEFKFGTPSSAISNYSLSSDVRGFTGLYEVGNSRPRLDMWNGSSIFLQSIVDKVMNDGEEKKLHLLCCQCFD